ncbi:hypothetical protein LTR66_002613 [Elasticomyces elasticus]|nr:hypothetical protein LTR50_003723 [Elasticomyces elasticus]KAK4998096.1 hypothetical protein LTR66_002613 [Elasticomyces elasticus]
MLRPTGRFQYHNARRAVRVLRRTYAATSIEQPAGSLSSEAEIQSAREYCLGLLRSYDTPSYILRTYIPPSALDAYLAIRALNVDVARTGDTTSTPTIALMRMQFQRDAITKALSGSPPKQPISLLLAKAQDDLQMRTGGQAKLSRSWLTRIVDTREQYLGNSPYSSMEVLERYAENTYSTLLYLTLQALPMASVTADHVASHVGKAAGIATVLRGLPLIAFPPAPNKHSNQNGVPGAVGASRQGAVMLPLDVMADTGVREEEVLRKGAEAQGLRDAVFTVATRANDHLITAREMLKNIRAGEDAGHAFEHEDEEEHIYGAVPSKSGNKAKEQKQEIERAMGIFMPAVATSLWLERLQKHDFDVFAPKLRVTDWRLPWKAFLAYSRKTI